MGDDGLRDYTKTYIMKPVWWAGRSLADVRDFPVEARSGLGREFRRVQMEAVPRDFNPMKTIGNGVFEIRVHTATEHQLIYIARYEEAIYVLHAFEKRTGRTPRRDIEVAARRLAEIIRQRQRKS